MLRLTGVGALGRKLQRQVQARPGRVGRHRLRLPALDAARVAAADEVELPLLVAVKEAEVTRRHVQLVAKLAKPSVARLSMPVGRA